jgi:hypothetical protein
MRSPRLVEHPAIAEGRVPGPERLDQRRRGRLEAGAVQPRALPKREEHEARAFEYRLAR